MLLEKIRNNISSNVCEPSMSTTENEYQFLKTPIYKTEFLNKINYESYFRIIGVPFLANKTFHTLAINKKISQAVEAVSPYLTKRNVRLITCHLNNTLERLQV